VPTPSVEGSTNNAVGGSNGSVSDSTTLASVDNTRNYCDDPDDIEVTYTVWMTDPSAFEFDLSLLVDLDVVDVIYDFRPTPSYIQTVSCLPSPSSLGTTSNPQPALDTTTTMTRSQESKASTLSEETSSSNGGIGEFHGSSTSQDSDDKGSSSSNNSNNDSNNKNDGNGRHRGRRDLLGHDALRSTSEGIEYYRKGRTKFLGSEGSYNITVVSNNDGNDRHRNVQVDEDEVEDKNFFGGAGDNQRYVHYGVRLRSIDDNPGL
jgi:hypothetical protein